MRDRPTVLPGAAERTIAIDFEGRRIPAVPGEPVAVALLREGQWVLSRSIKYHRPRGAFCFAAGCGNCLMRVGGLPDRLSCSTPCSDGLSVASQNALPNATGDLLRTIDWAFPRGMDHHSMFAGVPLAESMMAKVARQLAGLGELPDHPAATLPNPPERAIDVCVVGLGQAGRAAATATEGRVLAVDADPHAEVEGLPARVEVWRGAVVLGLYRDGGAPLLVVRYEGAVHRVRPKAVVLCTGSRDQNALFDKNDLPGILGGRAVLRLLRRHRLLPSRSALVLGEGPDAPAVCRELLEAGAAVTWAGAGPAPELAGIERWSGFAAATAHGGSHVTGLTLVSGSGEERRWRGGLVAICGPRAPAFELAVHAGAAIAFVARRGYAIQAADDGATSVPWLWAAGSCAGDVAGVAAAQALNRSSSLGAAAD